MRTQPNRDTPIPPGATHWAIAYAYCFYLIAGDNVSNYRDGKWHLLDRTPPPRKSPYHSKPVDPVLSILRDLIPLSPIEIPIGSPRILSKFGAATDLGCGAYILDHNPFPYEPVYLHSKDLVADTSFTFAGKGVHSCAHCARIYDDLDLVACNGKCPSDDCPSYHQNKKRL